MFANWVVRCEEGTETQICHVRPFVFVDCWPGFPTSAGLRLRGQPKRDGDIVNWSFDADQSLIGTNVDNLPVRSISDIRQAVEEDDIAIGIVAVPAVAAQSVIDSLVDAGIGAILNYAPVTAYAPDHVKIKNIDPVISLQSMTYYLAGSSEGT